MTDQSPLVVVERNYPLRRRAAGFTSFLVFIFLTALITVVAMLVTKTLPLYLGVLLPIAAELVTIALFYKYSWGSTPIKDALFLRKITFKEGLRGALIGLGLFCGLQAVAYLLSLAGIKSEDSVTSSMLSKATGADRFIALYLLVPFAAPFAEELFFRSFICGSLYYSGLKERTRKWLPLLFSSATFALVHYQGHDTANDLFLLIWIFLVGAVHAILLIKYKSVLVPFFTHLTYNGVSALLMVLAMLGK